MRDRQLYAQILGIQSPWTVTDVKLNLSEKVVEVYLASNSGKRMPCPVCEKACPGYDRKERRWVRLFWSNHIAHDYDHLTSVSLGCARGSGLGAILSA
jgi:hypothetical protein